MKKTFLKILFTIIPTIFIGCNKNEKNENSDRKILLVATQDLSDINQLTRTFKIFTDSTFVFTENLKETNHSKSETFEGKVKINKDTIKFFPFNLNYNNAETAVLKNGFVEFIDAEYPDRLRIESTSLFTQNNIDFSKFQNYTVFTFYKKNNQYLAEKKYSNYDLTTSELKKIENILKSAFQKNDELRNYSDYIKQINSVKNEKNQNIIFIKCFCKAPHLEKKFEYTEIEMLDGGNCNVFIILNLTTQKIEMLKIAGMA